MPRDEPPEPSGRSAPTPPRRAHDHVESVAVVLLGLVAALVILLAMTAAAGVGLALLVGPLIRALDAHTGPIVPATDGDLLWWSLAVLAIALVSDRLHR